MSVTSSSSDEVLINLEEIDLIDWATSSHCRSLPWIPVTFLHPGTCNNADWTGHQMTPHEGSHKVAHNSPHSRHTLSFYSLLNEERSQLIQRSARAFNFYRIVGKFTPSEKIREKVVASSVSPSPGWHGWHCAPLYFWRDAVTPHRTPSKIFSFGTSTLNLCWWRSIDRSSCSVINKLQQSY